MKASSAAARTVALKKTSTSESNRAIMISSSKLSRVTPKFSGSGRPRSDEKHESRRGGRGPLQSDVRRRPTAARQPTRAIPRPRRPHPSPTRTPSTGGCRHDTASRGRMPRSAHGERPARPALTGRESTPTRPCPARSQLAQLQAASAVDCPRNRAQGDQGRSRRQSLIPAAGAHPSIWRRCRSLASRSAGSRRSRRRMCRSASRRRIPCARSSS